MNKNLLVILIFGSTLFAKIAYGQCTTNFLKNPSFELPVQTVIGNNFPVTITNWTVAGGSANLIRVNGSNYYGGPNNAASGNQYFDVVSANGTIEQSFTTTCPSVITFSGSFSSREIGRNWTARIEIINSSNVVVATSATRNFTTADADNNPPGADAIWYNLSGTSASVPADVYRFRAYVDDYGNFDNAFMCVTPGCVLPVKLSEFKALNNTCTPKLQWKSSQEYNLKQFEIEGSADGISFTKIGIVKAVGGIDGTTYTYTDNTQNMFIHFYRLKMLDFDGAYKYSDILKLDKTCANKLFSLSSSLIKNELGINYFSAINSNANYLINASDGKLIISGKLANGANKIITSNFSVGVYFITLLTADTKQTLKFIKQ